MTSASPLPFTVSPVLDDTDLAAACAVRAQGYGHHVPEMTDALAQPDALDLSDDATVFLARAHDGRPLGTVRVNIGRSAPLPIVRSAGLAADSCPGLKAELARLATVRGAHPLVKVTLFKAGFLHCLANQVQWMVIGARSEALVRTYERLCFEFLLEGRQVPLDYAGDLPHWVLAFNVQRAERTWFERSNALYAYMFQTYHPELTIFRPRAKIAIAA